jgi:hypothetical protein
MTILNIDDLTDFLSRWYAVTDLGLPCGAIDSEAIVPETLRLAWLKIGRLSVGYEEWVRTGNPSPLACQDGFVAPAPLLVRDGISQVVTENQGNWSIGYEEGDQMIDPPVFTDFLEQEIGGVGFVPLGCNLSSLIITSVLAETVFFGSISIPSIEELAAECDNTIWIGQYYNAVGQGDEYEVPSHQIRTNNEENMLGLYWGGKFSGFLASSSKGRERLKPFL